MRVAAVQLRSTTDVDENATIAARLVREAADGGARYIQTPEVTNLVQKDREAARRAITTEDKDPVIAALRAVAAERQVTVHIGSAVVRVGDSWRNRAFLIAPDGTISARYDKIHMFDVDLPNGERYRESRSYTPGDCAIVAPVGDLAIGMTICFDVRFPRIYDELAVAGANVLTAPAAFAERTGRDHWHVLNRARAIENGAFMVSAAQEGLHADGRTTYGHSLIIGPWGDILAEAVDTPSVILADLDPAAAATVRQQIPVLTARRDIAVARAEARGTDFAA